METNYKEKKKKRNKVICDYRLRALALHQRSKNFVKDQAVNVVALGELSIPIMLTALPLWPGSRCG